MKSSIFKIFNSGIIAGAVFAVIFGFTSPASAGWNDTGSNSECPTFSVAVFDSNLNAKSGVGDPCWNGVNVSAAANDIINVKVYFHNNTGSTVSGVLVKTSDNRNLRGAISLSGSVIVNGSTVADGGGSVTIPAGTRLEYRRSQLEIQSNNPQTPITTNLYQNTDIFGSGYNVGTLPSAWIGGQGVIKVSYEVVPDAIVVVDTTVNKPTATTYAPASKDTAGNATLSGVATSNGSDMTSWFRYYPGNSNCTSTGIDTSKTNNGNAGTVTRSKSVSGFVSGINSYQLMVSAPGTSEISGGCQSFTINGTNIIINNGTLPDVTTYAESNLNSGNGDVVLNGWFNGNGLPTTTCFEIDGTNYSNRTVGCTDRGNTSGNYNYSLYSLPTGSYEYRAYAYNSAGERKGSWESFYINRRDTDIYYPPVDTRTYPGATTLVPVTVGNTYATLDGYYQANGCNTNTWFEYGPNQNSLIYRTAEVSRGTGSGSASQSLTGLVENTAYYYKVVARNCYGTTSGSVRYFVTTGTVNNVNTVYVTPKTVTNRTVVSNTNTNQVIGTGIRGNFIKLMIDNSRTSIRKNDQVTYEVNWENVSSVTLNDLVLEVSFPKELTIVDSSRGDIDRSANAVYLNIDRLDSKEEGRMLIMTRMKSSVLNDAPLVARAIMAFENPTLDGAQENAIAYDADNYDATGDSSVLGASIFGLGFLPGNLVGWLIIFLIILLIIIAARYYTRGENNRPDQNGGNGGYAPYRPQA